VAEPPTGTDIVPGDTITYTVTVTNTNSNANVVATGVVVTDVWTVDPDVAATAAGISSGDFTWSPATIPGATAAWVFTATNDLAGGSSISFQITATVDGTIDGAVITNSAVADADLLTPTLESVVSRIRCARLIWKSARVLTRPPAMLRWTTRWSTPLWFKTRPLPRPLP
jgi:hypothetical protein